MLITSAAVAVGEVRYASMMAFEREFRVYYEDRRATVWDTRFVNVVERDRALGERAVLCFVLDGWMTWHAAELGTFEAPAAFVASQNAIDGIADGSFRHSAGGHRFRSVQVRLITGPALADGRPRALDLSPALTNAVRELADAAAKARGIEQAVARLLAECHAARFIDRDLSTTIVWEEPASVTRIWRAIRASHLLLAKFPALEGVVAGAGISVRQVTRAIDDLRATFGFEWGGWREVVHDLRLRWAVLLLSCNSVPIADVARSAGYGSVTAFGAALRNVGLPAPRDVRRLIGEWAHARTPGARALAESID
jgi:AraC-like DNA-binding protein